MALNIKDPETERLAAEVAALTGETKTGAVRHARRMALEARSRPSIRQREEHLTRFLEEEILDHRLRRGSRQRGTRRLLPFRRGQASRRLNLGDCCTYATASIAREPLLCIGDDFVRTDLLLVGLDADQVSD
jgi:uncharacterized protein with PIN domain